jgi:hypothetical protein
MITIAALRVALQKGLQKGLRGTLWMLKILVPCSFLTFMIDVSGVLVHLEFVLTPAMGVLSLPPEAALPLTAGLLAGIYGAVAAMAVLDFSMTEAVLIAVFLLISHNIIQEGIVQARSGLTFFKATLARLTASVVTVLCLAPLLPAGGAVAVSADAAAAPAATGWAGLFSGWLWGTALLSLQILAIITAMMIVMEVLRAARVIPVLARLLQPLLTVMGLSRRVGILWLTAAVFGLSYGAAVIVEEAREGRFEKGEIEGLQLSIGINHALIEDPAIFLALGLPAFWLWVPRLMAALLAVHLYRLGAYWRLRRRTKAGHRSVVETAARAIE